MNNTTSYASYYQKALYLLYIVAVSLHMCDPECSAPETKPSFVTQVL